MPIVIIRLKIQISVSHSEHLCQGTYSFNLYSKIQEASKTLHNSQNKHFLLYNIKKKLTTITPIGPEQMYNFGRQYVKYTECHLVAKENKNTQHLLQLKLEK